MEAEMQVLLLAESEADIHNETSHAVEFHGLQMKKREFEIFGSQSMVIGKLLECLLCLCFMLDIVIIL